MHESRSARADKADVRKKSVGQRVVKQRGVKEKCGDAREPRDIRRKTQKIGLEHLCIWDFPTVLLFIFWVGICGEPRDI